MLSETTKETSSPQWSVKLVHSQAVSQAPLSFCRCSFRLHTKQNQGAGIMTGPKQDNWTEYSPVAGAGTLHGCCNAWITSSGLQSQPSPPQNYHLCHSANPKVQSPFSEAALHYIISSRSLTLHDRGWYTLTHVWSSSVCCSALPHNPKADSLRQ